MSAPAPCRVKLPVPESYEAVPAGVVEPMSCDVQPLGSVDSSDAYGVIVTLSNVAVASAPSLWLVTASPASTMVPSAIVSALTCVQSDPSADVYARKVVPVRDTLTQ